MAYVRKVPTTSGATAVQVVHKFHGEIVKLEHIGSAQCTDLSQKKFVHTLKPIRSGVITISDIDYPTEPEISIEVKQIVEGLRVRD